MPELAGGDVELLTSELATNALRHAASPLTVIVRYDGRAVRVEVGDGSPELPTSRSPGLSEPHGRGLMLIDALSSGWGVTPTRDGKRVWFEVDVDVGGGGADDAPQ
jgi:anti-sigma regulatory factor (Ser/Thr protein kinase)